MSNTKPSKDTIPYLVKFLTWLSTQDKEKIFKTPLGRYRLNSLFFEQKNLTTYEDEPIFTLKSRHYKNYWSFPLLYLEIADVTEYEFGQQCLYDYEHFRRLAGSAAEIRKCINKCRDELERKVRSEALIAIRSISKTGGDSSALAAAKFLAKREWVEDKKTREAIVREQKFVKQAEDDFHEDFKLLNNESSTSETAAN